MFLKMLANQCDTYHDVQSDVHYDYLTPEVLLFTIAVAFNTPPKTTFTFLP